MFEVFFGVFEAFIECLRLLLGFLKVISMSCCVDFYSFIGFRLFHVLLLALFKLEFFF